MIADETNSYVRSDRVGDEPDIRIAWINDKVAGFLSIVIPVHEDVQGLKDTLSSLIETLDVDGKWEIIVANDGGDPRVRVLANTFGVQVIDIVPNGGSYAARNSGIEVSKGEVIVFLDADVTVDRAWYRTLRLAMPEFDLFTGRVEMKLGPAPAIWECYQAVSYFSCETAMEGLIATAHAIVRRQVFENLGGFDRRLRSAGDYEFSLRVKESGKFRIGYCPDLMALHPCRNLVQLFSSSKRTMFGQFNLLELYGRKMESAAKGVLSPWKLLVPRKNLFLNSDVARKFTFGMRVKIWIFAWYFKLRSIPILHSVRRQFRMAREPNSLQRRQ